MRALGSGLFVAALAVVALGAAEFRGDTDKDRARVTARRNWWSFQPVRRPAVPEVGAANPVDARAANPVDAFLLKAMRAKGLTPNPPLSKEKLLRRVTLDLTGLPPTPDETAAFLKDTRADAYEHLVDRLMASPRYGERWALRWLDVARYADTNGFEIDALRPHAWRYRDYVIRSFNADKPFDRFLKEQVAGDEVYPGDKDALVALGFHRAGPEHLVSGNQDVEQNRQEVLIEMTAGIGNVFLGLTVNCARCHNHKFDPILQSDYYRIQAVFANTHGKEIEIAGTEEKARYEEAKKAWKARMDPVEKAIKEIEKPYREKLIAEKKARLPEDLRKLLDIPKEQLSEQDKIRQKDAREQSTPAWDEVLETVPKPELEKRAALRKQLHEIELDEPQPPAHAYAVVNGEKHEEVNVLKVGDHKMKLGTVSSGVPLVLATAFRDQPMPPPTDIPGSRKALAEWLADPAHPLVPRVMANRIWQFRMGRGIVGTPNDFGTLGERPTHPELLDWLASEFVARNYSVKALDRLIVTSAAYRMAPDRDAGKQKLDPDNKFYWRANRRRLEGESIRDSILAATGLLNEERFGPPVRVPIEPEVYDTIFTEFERDNLWPLPKDRSQIYRRSIYLLNKRTVRLPMMTNFDQPDTMTSCAFRPTSTHALQALTMMNSDFLAEQSAAFAKRVESEAGKSRPQQVRRAYGIALARTPSAAELRMAADFFAKGGNLQEFCLAMLNRSEFVYIP